ncbi:MAG: hypothetical protein QOE54_1577 [Streptosporangiaceae bacterium]|nr:hypothetical protein [Streptosporangiaceae bacterium]
MSSELTTPRGVRTVRRLALPAVLAIIGVMLFGFMAPAQADDVSQIANGLRSSKLYVSTDVPNALSPSDQEAVRAALNNAKDVDIRVVVTKSTQNGVTQRQLVQMLRSVQQRVGKGEVYLAVTADDKMTGIAKSGVLSGTELNQIISQASGSDIKTRVITFVQLADKKAKDKASASATNGLVVLGVLVLIVAGGAGLFLVARKKKRDRQAQQMAELKASVEEDVTRLGEDISGLDLAITDPKLPAEAREDYTRALDSYDSAKTATERAQRPEDMTLVTKALEEGRYSMMAVRARLAGEPVPERRAPCFFNPQHGPSVQDVSWAPMGGMPRSVPACAADAARIMRGESPDSRLVEVGGHRRPYWDAGPAYGPYAGGYYSGYGGGDMLSGLLIGTAIGSMFGGGWGGGGFGGGWGGNDSGGGGIDFGGDSGDAGGGWDFCGGDFGGGGAFGGGGDF